MSAETPRPARKKAQVAYEILMLVLALTSVGLVTAVEVADLDWPQPRFILWAKIDLVFVGIFGTELLVGLVRAKSRRQYLRAHWYDFFGLMPLYVESWSWLRALRLLRVIRVLRLFRLVPAARRALGRVEFVRKVVRESRIAHLVVLASVLIGSIATGFWVLEHRTNEGIRDFDDALWWAITTVTTVGYGDIAPRTGVGRLLASILMLLGIGLIGSLGAALTATMIRVNAREDEASAEQSINALLDEHALLVAARERGELTADEYQRRRGNLIAIARIKTEAD